MSPLNASLALLRIDRCILVPSLRYPSASKTRCRKSLAAWAKSAFPDFTAKSTRVCMSVPNNTVFLVALGQENHLATTLSFAFSNNGLDAKPLPVFIT